MARTTCIEIDPNVRTPRGTYSGFEDADGPVAVGDIVNVRESESGLFGGALVTGIDEATRMIFLSVAWSTLTFAYRTGASARREVQGFLELDAYLDDQAIPNP